jgi:enoyl-CoA hydratase/carnithine racemase
MAGSVSVSRQGAVARVCLSHPARLNAMTRAMWIELRRVFLELQAGDARCIVMAGDAGNFCAGGDISEYAAFRFASDTLREFHEEEVAPALQAMLDCDVPIVAQIEGACMGAGVELASCCDIRLAGTSARFGAPIARLGFPMAPREAAIVHRAVGDLTARQMLLEAAVLSAAQMAQRGFLSQVTTDADVAAQADDTARRIAALAPKAARMNKQTLRALAPVAPALQVMVASAYDYADSPEHREGIEAFIARRTPRF